MGARAADDSSALIQLGIVGAPFGVRGWVKLRSHTDPPERLLEHRSLHIGRHGAWVVYDVESKGRSGGQLTAKLAGVTDRDQAASLRGSEVAVPRAELPQRDDKDYYRADLIGCRVVNLNGDELGTVQHFVETPAQALMVVKGPRTGTPTGNPKGLSPGGATVDLEYWVPAVPKHLRRVDLTARRIVVDWDAESA